MTWHVYTSDDIPFIGQKDNLFPYPARDSNNIIEYVDALRAFTNIDCANLT